MFFLEKMVVVARKPQGATASGKKCSKAEVLERKMLPDSASRRFECQVSATVSICFDDHVVRRKAQPITENYFKS